MKGLFLHSFFSAVPLLFGAFVRAVEGQTVTSAPTIVRKSLLTAELAGDKAISRVEVKEINFVPGQKTPLHLHPCPVVGYIAEGTVTFQIEGQALQTLNAGDAFFEPANVRILHFDAEGEKVKFIAYYLLGKGDHELITML